MKSLTIILLVGLTVSLMCVHCAPSARKCDIVCTTDYNPVYASDGKVYMTFSNKCLMEKYNCEHNTNFMEVTPSVHYDPTRECDFICTTDYNPVNASDGKVILTFSNKCLMEKYNCEHNTNFIEVTSSVHDAPARECDFVCTTDYSPVCGSDGKVGLTFSNKCTMEKYNCDHNTKFTIKSEGECPNGNGNLLD